MSEDRPPADVTDVRLWKDAQPLRRRHHQDTFPEEGRCAFCHGEWPCPPRLWADRADRLARVPASIHWLGGGPYGGARPTSPVYPP